MRKGDTAQTDWHYCSQGKYYTHIKDGKQSNLTQQTAAHNTTHTHTTNTHNTTQTDPGPQKSPAHPHLSLDTPTHDTGHSSWQNIMGVRQQLFYTSRQTGMELHIGKLASATQQGTWHYIATLCQPANIYKTYLRSWRPTPYSWSPEPSSQERTAACSQKDRTITQSSAAPKSTKQS